MAGTAKRSGISLVVWDRRDSGTTTFPAQGAEVERSVAGAVQDAVVVSTMVTNADAVLSVARDQGLLESTATGGCLGADEHVKRQPTPARPRLQWCTHAGQRQASGRKSPRVGSTEFLSLFPWTEQTRAARRRRANCRPRRSDPTRQLGLDPALPPRDCTHARSRKDRRARASHSHRSGCIRPEAMATVAAKCRSS